MTSSTSQRSVFSKILHVVDTTRIVIVNILFFGLLLWLLVAIFSGDGVEPLPNKFVLQLNPAGIVVEEYSGSPADRMMDAAAGFEVDPEVRLRDLISVLEHAKDDDRVAGLVLDLEDFWYAGPAQLQELGAALQRFKASGKPVQAFGAWYDQNAYYLAAHADDVLLAEGGTVLLEGFSVYQNYFADALEQLKVDVHVFKAGEFKAAVEPYIRNDMSLAAKEANQALVDSLWAGLSSDIAQQRQVATERLDEYINNFTDNVVASAGDASITAAEYALITAISNPLHAECLANAAVVSAADLARSECTPLLDKEADYEAVDRVQKKIAHMPRIEYVDYLYDISLNAELNAIGKTQIGVIVASGMIVSGEQAAGMIGSDSTIRLINQARDDDDIAAVVLRIDSPGGDALASDEILVALEELRAVKPIVVSMGTVAASGGYWIALGGDEILAEPTTITGSIGVFGMFPTIEKSLNEIGVYTDGVGTHALSGTMAMDRNLDPKVAAAFNAMVQHTYQNFIELVAEKRGMSVAEVDAVAQGRVWTGEQAFSNGLVDEMGGLYDAVQSAAEWAKVDNYVVAYVEPELTFLEEVLFSMAYGSAQADAEQTIELPRSHQLAKANQWLELANQLADRPSVQQAMQLLQSKRPLVSHCMCDLPRTHLVGRQR